jgi:hypothetical protein
VEGIDMSRPEALFRTSHLAIVLTMTMTLASCSRGTLSRSAAADLIRRSEKFKSVEVVQFVVNGNQTFPVLNIIPNIAEGKLYIALQSLGYINVKRDSAGLTHIELSDKGNQAVSSGKWKSSAGGYWQFIVEVPVVRPEFVEVTGITTGEKEARAEFTWKKVLTEDGQQLQKNGMTFDPANDPSGMKAYSFRLNTPLPGAALFALYDDGWRLAKLDGVR